MTAQAQADRMEKQILLKAPVERPRRWHPDAIDSNKDYSHQPGTLVPFELGEVPRGTLLEVTESGFDGIPLQRRESACRGNSEGWSIQMGNIERHVSKLT